MFSCGFLAVQRPERPFCDATTPLPSRQAPRRCTVPIPTAAGISILRATSRPATAPRRGRRGSGFVHARRRGPSVSSWSAIALPRMGGKRLQFLSDLRQDEQSLGQRVCGEGRGEAAGGIALVGSPILCAARSTCPARSMQRSPSRASVTIGRAWFARRVRRGGRARRSPSRASVAAGMYPFGGLQPELTRRSGVDAAPGSQGVVRVCSQRRSSSSSRTNSRKQVGRLLVTRSLLR